jgi:acetylornithine deacetylase/succinyl-diaminopimelate desuccinylase-like protein
MNRISRFPRRSPDPALGEASGLRVRLLETEGNPLIYGEWEQRPGLPTLLITTHYDIQPPGPWERWSNPPFEGAIDADRVWGAGASDAKGPLTAILKAAETVTRAIDRPATNLKVLFDGEEEIGSPSMPCAVERYRDLIMADGVLTFDGNSAADGRALINFGGGGLLYLELEADTLEHDIHANRGALVPNAAWRLVWALGTLKTPDEQITIDGFDEHLNPITDGDRELLKSHTWDESEELRALGTRTLLPGRGGARVPEALHLLPIVAVSGISTGYTDDGVVTILPAKAKARVSIYLRAAQEPDDILRKLRSHLDRRGFSDIKITRLVATEPSSVPPDSPIGLLVRRQAESFFGVPPVVYPRAHWYGRQGSWIASRLGVPAAQISVVAPPQPNNPGPDEYMLFDYFLRGTRYIARILLAAEDLPVRPS